MKVNTMLYWAARAIAVILMVQTLYYKFTAAEESVYIFTTVGMEPWGRITVGVLELVASVLILINTTAWLGGLLALGLMGGALLMHLTILGVVVKEDGGQLFAYALTIMASSVFIVFTNRALITKYAKRLTVK